MLNKLIYLCFTLASSVYADSAYDLYLEHNNGSYLNSSDLNTLQKLEQKDKVGIDGMGLNGTIANPGEVVFSYGASRAIVVCSMLELCDIALEAGEKVNSVQIGDSARWQVSSAISGSGEFSVYHLVVKPLDNGLKTSLLITTDRRSYHLQLKSSHKGFMPQVRFIYPNSSLEELNQSFKNNKQIASNNIQAKHKAIVSENLNFNYAFEGDRHIMPKVVYHDGKRTYIELNPKFRAHKLPALLIVEQEGGLFTKSKEYISNYRIINNKYVVDGVVLRARLILGDNGENYSVDIVYKER